jgi:hypothetical protein
VEFVNLVGLFICNGVMVVSLHLNMCKNVKDICKGVFEFVILINDMGHF